MTFQWSCYRAIKDATKVMYCPYNNQKDIVRFKSVLLTDFTIKYHRLHITYHRHKLKQFQLIINHGRPRKAIEVLIKVHFTILRLSWHSLYSTVFRSYLGMAVTLTDPKRS